MSLRPIALRHLKKQVPGSATNVDALIGAHAVAISAIDQLAGQIKLSGEIWSAHADSGVIQSGENVVVIAIDGAVARVKKIEET
jgi:membrane protein implicated in regulation of membrane protease activity